jgi:hypothetical protein
MAVRLDGYGQGDLARALAARLRSGLAPALAAVREEERAKADSLRAIAAITFHDSLRPPLRRFAIEMECWLRANDHKGGWRDCDPAWLLARLREEAKELEQAMARGVGSEIRREAADVANFAMMIADQKLPALHAPAPAPATGDGARTCAGCVDGECMEDRRGLACSRWHDAAGRRLVISPQPPPDAGERRDCETCATRSGDFTEEPCWSCARIGAGFPSWTRRPGSET